MNSASNDLNCSNIKEFYMNRLLVITGGSKGIGRAVVEKFSSASFDVMVSARNIPDLQNLQSEVEKKHGNRVYVFGGDMATADGVKAFVDFVLVHNRSVDVLINNAGYFTPGEICTEPNGTLESMINANLYSAYNMTRGIVPVMKENKDGHIFNMCSIASFKAYPNGGSYAISKFALLGFSKCLREELKNYGIRVTAVMPGATKTASWEGSNLPDSRFIKPEDVAESIYSAHMISKRSVVEEIIIRPLEGDI
jgi:short-subunit dehydrogenase